MLNRILGLIGWLGTILVFGAVVVRIARPEWDQYAIYAVWAGLASVLLYTAGQWREIATALSRRQARYGALASASVLVVLGILVAVNYLSARTNKRWDLTANRQFSLSEQTVKLLRGLDAPVKVLVFDQGTNLDAYRARLTEYEYYSTKLKAEYIDVDKKPVQAKQYNVEAYGTLVIEAKGRQERTTSASEQDVTNALIKVLSGEKQKVYFVDGHGEKDLTGTGRDGYSTVTAALGRDNYEVGKLVLAQVEDVPADAAVLVLAGPKSDVLQPEADRLRRYLARGGHVLAMLDPADNLGATMPNLETLAKEWNIALGTDVVVDASGMGQMLGTDASVPVAASYPAHPITERFRMMTAFPLARSVSPTTTEPTGGKTVRRVVETSQRSWAEADVKGMRETGKVSMDVAAGDKPGPVPIAAAAVAPVDAAADAAAPAGAKKAESRLVVVGDSDFASNYAVAIQGNKDLFLNMVNWLAQQENLISIRPTQASDRRIMMTASQQTGLFWFSLLFIPAAILGAGVYNWSRRR